MNTADFKNKLYDLRPHYSDKYRPMIEAISNKGERTGKGDIAQFGAFYQTFMYACIIGIRLGEPKYFEAGEQTSEFAPMFKWKPIQICDYIIMMMFNRCEQFGYTWMSLENANDENIEKFVRLLEREIEGYANRGFEYLQKKWDEERVKFQSPTIFVDLLLNLGK